MSVKGEVDLVTAPDLGAVVGAVIDRGHRYLVLDLEETDFMDARGLKVIADGAGRLDPVGGRLTVRSPSAVVVRALEVTGVPRAVRLEPAGTGTRRLGSWRPPAVPAAAISTGAAVLASHTERVTAIPASDDVVDRALRLVVALARATVVGAHGVSVSLKRHGRLATVAATDHTISEMDHNQYATGEGPCVDASVEGRPFYVESLDRETRWPAFIPKARALGINAIFSTPLVAGARTVGALNIYSRTAACFAARERDLAAVFATEASVLLRDAGADVPASALARRLHEALIAREVIFQAQGMVMARQGVSATDAYTMLRRLSVRTDKPLRDVAASIVGSAFRADDKPT